MSELWIIPICIVLLGIISMILLKMIDNLDLSTGNDENYAGAAELIKWASTKNHLPNEIYICHERRSASGTPTCGDYEEKWWIEEKRVDKEPHWNY